MGAPGKYREHGGVRLHFDVFLETGVSVVVVVTYGITSPPLPSPVPS